MSVKDTMRRLINERTARDNKPAKKHNPFADLKDVYRSSVSRDPSVRFHGYGKA